VPNNDPFMIVYVAAIFIGIPIVGVIVLATIAGILAKIVERLEQRFPRTVRFTLPVILMLVGAALEVCCWKVPSLRHYAVTYISVILGVFSGVALKWIFRGPQKAILRRYTRR
jgi:predicted tellurium resistance membrane protein TerC